MPIAWACDWRFVGLFFPLDIIFYFPFFPFFGGKKFSSLLSCSKPIKFRLRNDVEGMHEWRGNRVSCLSLPINNNLMVRNNLYLNLILDKFFFKIYRYFYNSKKIYIYVYNYLIVRSIWHHSWWSRTNNCCFLFCRCGQAQCEWVVLLQFPRPEVCHRLPD